MKRLLCLLALLITSNTHASSEIDRIRAITAELQRAPNYQLTQEGMKLASKLRNNPSTIVSLNDMFAVINFYNANHQPKSTTLEGQKAIQDFARATDHRYTILLSRYLSNPKSPLFNQPIHSSLINECAKQGVNSCIRQNIFNNAYILDRNALTREEKNIIDREVLRIVRSERPTEAQVRFLFDGLVNKLHTKNNDTHKVMYASAERLDHFSLSTLTNMYINGAMFTPTREEQVSVLYLALQLDIVGGDTLTMLQLQNLMSDMSPSLEQRVRYLRQQLRNRNIQVKPLGMFGIPDIR
ncbi:hypothetical protein AB4254_08860 [Vibrio breoganii]